MDFEAFKQKLRAYMDAKGETPAGIARKAGLDNSTIRQWYEGRSQSARMSSIQKLFEGAIPMTFEQFMATDILNYNHVGGFAESSLEAWQGKQEDGLAEPDMAAIAPDATHPALYLVRGPAFMRLGIEPMTFLVVDLNARAEPGQLAVANQVDLETGSAETILGRILEPYLILPAFEGAGDKYQIIDNNRLSIMGPVVAVEKAAPN